MLGSLTHLRDRKGFRAGIPGKGEGGLGFLDAWVLWLGRGTKVWVAQMPGFSKRGVPLSPEVRPPVSYPLSVQTLLCACPDPPGGAALPVKVLNCDTVTQAKEKLLDALHRGAPMSQRPRANDLELGVPWCLGPCWSGAVEAAECLGSPWMWVGSTWEPGFLGSLPAWTPGFPL